MLVGVDKDATWESVSTVRKAGGAEGADMMEWYVWWALVNVIVGVLGLIVYGIDW